MSAGPPLHESIELVVALNEAGWRLDAFLAYHLNGHSRVVLRRAITAGGVQVDGRGTKPAYRLVPGQRVTLVVPEVPRECPQPEDIPLDIIYQDEWLAVVNKPPGMVVHPARGHWTGTMASAVQHHLGQLSSVGGPTRPGIVHRLDRDTSGLILVARNDQAHFKLAMQFEQRSIEKEYFAVVCGQPRLDRDLIDRPIGVHPHQRDKMAILPHSDEARSAQSFYEVEERFDGFATVRIHPRTGRTHQIRVHLNHIGCPVLCDRQYGGRAQITRGEIRRTPADTCVLLERQALHAYRLRVRHPKDDAVMQFEAPLPADIRGVIEELRVYRRLSR